MVNDVRRGGRPTEPEGVSAVRTAGRTFHFEGRNGGQNGERERITTLPMARAELLSWEPHRSLFNHIREWSGAVDENLGKLFGDTPGEAETALQDLFRAGLVQFKPVWRTSRNIFLQHPHSVPRGQKIVRQVRMFYVDKDAGAYLRIRDGLAHNYLTPRHNGALNQDHRAERPHRSHTGQLHDVVTSLILAGNSIYSGRRDRRDVPLLQKLAPDAMLPAVVPKADVHHYKIEGEAIEQIMPVVQKLVTDHCRQEPAPTVGPLCTLLCRDKAVAQDAQYVAAVVLRQNGLVNGRDMGPAFLTLDDIDRPAASSTLALLEAFPLYFSNTPLNLEYERSARTPRRVRKKLRYYFECAKEGDERALAFITESDSVESFVHDEYRALVQEYGFTLTVVTSTYDRITRELAPDRQDVWTRNGHSVVLL